MLAVLELARERGQVTEQELKKVQELLAYFELPLSINQVSKERIYQQMFLDKKVKQNKIRFVLPKGIGEVYTTSEVSENEIMKAIDFVVKI